VADPIIYRVSNTQGGAGFLPSTVVVLNWENFRPVDVGIHLDSAFTAAQVGDGWWFGRFFSVQPCPSHVGYGKSWEITIFHR